MSAITLNEEQTKLFRLCLKHSEPLKPNWEKVAEEADLVSTSAASQRWGRLYKILLGDEKPSTPSKAKGTGGKTGHGTPKQRKGTNKKTAAAKADKASDKGGSVEIDGNNATQPADAPQTPKKRSRDTELVSDEENETPHKIEKVEIKDEDD